MNDDTTTDSTDTQQATLDRFGVRRRGEATIDQFA